MKNNVKIYREQLKLTQDQLATLTNVSRQTIISLEKFKYTASLQLAWKLSKVFNTTIESLLIKRYKEISRLIAISYFDISMCSISIF